MNYRRIFCLCLVPFLTASASAAEKKTPSVLTLERLYGSEEFQTKEFSARWSEDGSTYVTLEDSAGDLGGKDIVAWDPADGTREILVPAVRLIPPGEDKPLTIEDYSFSQDGALVLIYTNSKRVWRRNTRGDYWVLDRASHDLYQLGGNAPASTLMFAKLSPSEQHVAYVRENNIYLEDLLSREITALTTDGSCDIINGTFDWVYEEELSLRDGFAWSPDGASIAYWQLDSHGVREFVLIDNTADSYPGLQHFKYPKVGQQNSAARIGVVNIRDEKTRWMQIPGDSRQHYLARMQWAENSHQLMVQQLNRLQNTNRVMLVDATDGAATTILTERDDAWVDVHDELLWQSDAKAFSWISERDGWRHAYLVDRSGDSVDLLTPGEYDVIQLLQVDSKRGWLYFLASPNNPTQSYLYRSHLDGSGLQRITPADQNGTHRYNISPDGNWAIHQWSSFTKPPQVELVQLPKHETIRVLEANQALAKKLERLQPASHEFFRVDIGNEVLLDGWCINPPDLDPAKKYPLLVYVYGEPAGQTVLDRWGGSSYLWHRMLAERGYVVVSIDNRGTPAPRGRDWRKIVYRQVGILAPTEQAAAVKQLLAERSCLDPDRIAVWGWSGGGSMSLNAIFKYPNLYQTAMSVAPVANQRMYDTIYQERYMGLPGDNVDGYLQGSPINFADQLKGNLLLVHGTGDDNCHYQTTEKLINELIRLNKPFSMMAYPNRSHSIREGENTTRHLRELLTRYLLQHVPPGPK